MADEIAKSAKQQQEAWLVAKILAGQTNLFTEVVRDYQGRIFGFLYRYTQNAEDAKDLAQRTFSKAFFKLHTFDQTKKFSTWLFAIAYHEAVNFYKSRPKDLSWEELQSSGKEPSTDWQPNLELAELRQIIQQAIQQLPAKYRLIITLYYQEELSYQEISELTGLTLNTVRTHLHRAKLQLEKILQKLID